jgi:DNA-binding NarL/FixJ family response regulator
VNENLIWMDHQKLFSTPQQPTESVTAFVTRIKNQARRLDLTPQTLLHSVIAGLRPNIRQFVVSQGGLTDLNTAIEIALKAEATAVSDPMTAMLMESVQTQSKLAETQAKQLHELTERVNALTATKTELVAASANHWKDERSENAAANEATEIKDHPHATGRGNQRDGSANP